MSLDFLAPVALGLFAPLLLLRRPLTGDERRSVRAAAGLWLVGIVGGGAFLVVNRHQLRLPIVIFGDHVWLLWAGILALIGSGVCLETAERSRRQEKERRFLRERDGLPPPLDEESPEEETRRLLAEVDRLKQDQQKGDADR